MPELDARKTEHGERLDDDTAHGDGERPGQHEITTPSTRDEAQEVHPGDDLGRYRVLDRLGQGGMGTVFRALDTKVERTVALKLLHTGTDVRHALRLRREAQAMARLSHPNIVPVYEVGQARGHWYLAMEFVDGQTLGRWRQGKHDWRARVGVYLQAGTGLAAAHDAGFVHRDFKPDNCLIDRSGRVRVLDFGLVRGSGFTIDEESIPSELDSDHGDISLTRTGSVLGTVAYMSLEQLSGNPVDARSDQFAFCVSLYEALYGMRPFAGEAVGRLTISLMNGDIRPAPRDTKVPERVRAVLLRGLATDPNERWATMDELLAALRRAAASRRRTVLAVVAGGLVLGGVATAALWPQGTACRGDRALLDGVWDEARRASVEAAFSGSGVSYASSTWTRVGPALDEYASGWQAKHTEVCEATHVRADQPPAVMDLRMQCLHRHRVELAKVVDVLAEANEIRVRRAVNLVAGLPPLTACDDVEALQARLPPPDDPAVAAEVERLRERLAQVRSLEAATEYSAALAEAEAIDALAQSLDYAPLQAETRYTRGSLRADKGHYIEAEKDLEQAYLLAVEHEHEAVARKAVLRLIFVVGHQGANPERGLWWSKTAQAQGRRVEDDPRFHSAWLLKVGIVLSDQGKFREGLDHYQRALALQKSAGLSRLTIADTLGQIGNGMVNLTRHDEGAAYYRQALAIWEEELGSEHPEVAMVFNNLGIVHLEKGEFDEALDYYRRGVDVWVKALGERHPHVGSAWANIGNVLQSQGKLPEALAHFERALSIWEESLGERDPKVAMLHSNIGGLLGSRGEYDRSLVHQRRAVALMEENLGPDHPDLATALGNIGVTLWRTGQLDEAVETLERAGDIAVRALGPKHAVAAQPQVVMAEISMERGDLEAAQQYAEKAVTILEANEGVIKELAYARFLLARTLWPTSGQRARARESALRARDAYTMLGEPGRDEAARIEAWVDNDGAEPEPEPEPDAGAP